MGTVRSGAAAVPRPGTTSRTEVTIRGFPPIADRSAQLLILGSMPGIASLEAHQYYAHPRNAFWPIVEELWGIPRTLEYSARTAALRTAGVAVWDVLAQCRRRSSLDSDIDVESIVVNDFTGFFRRHPQVRLIGFKPRISTIECITVTSVVPTKGANLR